MVRNIEECLAQITRATAFRSAFMQQPPIDAPLLQPLLDATDLFTRLKIPYALVGGIAAMVYGRARFTDDIDFVASANYETVLAANPKIVSACNFDPSCTWKLYHSSGTTIDIWKDEFTDQIAARAKETTVSGRTLRVAEVHDLVAMKLRAGRFQDDYDVSEILLAGQIDPTTLKALITPEQFAHFEEVQRRAQRK